MMIIDLAITSTDSIQHSIDGIQALLASARLKGVGITNTVISTTAIKSIGSNPAFIGFVIATQSVQVTRSS
jgi:hypothetical protein